MRLSLSLSPRRRDKINDANDTPFFFDVFLSLSNYLGAGPVAVLWKVECSPLSSLSVRSCQSQALSSYFRRCINVGNPKTPPHMPKGRVIVAHGLPGSSKTEEGGKEYRGEGGGRAASQVGSGVGDVCSPADGAGGGCNNARAPV